jgi:hypothetical protein
MVLKSMTTKQQCVRALKKIQTDCEVEHVQIGQTKDTNLVAPIGYHFDDGLHAKVTCTKYRHFTEHWGIVLEEINSIDYVEKCTSETCHEWQNGECGVWGELLREMNEDELLE